MIEIILLTGNLIILSLALISLIAGNSFNVRSLKRAGGILLIASSVTLFIHIVVRWIVIGRPPIYGPYESMLLGSFAALIIYLLFKNQLPENIFGIFVSLFAIFMLAFGSFSDKFPAVLGLAFRSNWLWFHIGFAWLAYASFIIAALFAIVNILPGNLSNEVQQKIKMESADNISFRLIIFGFLAHTVEIASGALWANDLYGKYWGWDPIETWSLIVWLIYATYLHLRVTLGWKGKKISLIAALAPIAVLVAYGGILFLDGLHGPLI